MSQHHVDAVITERWYCVFSSSFRYDAAPCISHETIDKVRTLCGRRVDAAAALESDNNNLEPDCRAYGRALSRLRQIKSGCRAREVAASVRGVRAGASTRGAAQTVRQHRL